MNSNTTNISTVTKRCILVYLFLLVALNTVSDGASDNTRWKMKINGPVYAFLKTDKHANIKWGVRHYVPRISRTTYQDE